MDKEKPRKSLTYGVLFGGGGRNRTGVDGFAIRCITTLLPRRNRRIDQIISDQSEFWSGKRGSNSRPQPWQGCALPTELFPRCKFFKLDSGAGNEARTRDLNLGKVALYQLSYSRSADFSNLFGAGNEARTRDLNLGKVALYQLSYSRITNFFKTFGAGNEARTRDLNLGKVALYQLSYSRIEDCFKLLERETRLELATSTLARLRSTN